MVSIFYRYSIATTVNKNPPTKPVSSCRLRLRPKYSLTEATTPAVSSVYIRGQKTAGSPAILSITKNATADPIAVRCVLLRVKRDIMRQNIVQRNAAEAILRNSMSDGERIIVMA